MLYIRMTRKFGWTKNVLIHQIGYNFRGDGMGNNEFPKG